MSTLEEDPPGRVRGEAARDRPELVAPRALRPAPALPRVRLRPRR